MSFCVVSADTIDVLGIVFLCGAWSLGISLLAPPMAPRPFCVSWDGVKWAANVPNALLGGGFDPGWGLCCEGLALAFDFLALAGVPSHCLPAEFGGGGGGRLQPISHRPRRHRMDVVPLVVLTVGCLVTRHHKQMVGSLLVRVPNQRHLA